MTKIWIYLVFLLVGIIIGMVIHYQLVKNKISSTTIKGKVKQKRTVGSNQDVRATIKKDDIVSGKARRKAKRISRQAKRLSDRKSKFDY